jgi:hypothetical protein
MSMVTTSTTHLGGVAPERDRELQEAVDAHCPVLDLTRNATPVTTSVQIA